MFYGRSRELEELNRRYASDEFQFIPVYGRRRVGKTALINEFVKDKVCVYFTAVKGSLNTNMRILASKILGIREPPAMNFEDVLDAMHVRFGNGRYVFVIDEFPNLVRADESVTGILNNFIESHLDSRLFLILSGSSMGIMQDQVLGRKSPLYGRCTGQIGLRPFRFSEIAPFLPGHGLEERMTIYGLVGGIPWYLSFFDNGLGLKENIIRNLIDPFAVLNREAMMLFSEEFDNPVQYYSVIMAISKGHSRLGNISTYVGLDSSRVTVLLKGLIDLEMVERITPIDDIGNRRTIYAIRDNYLRSYFRFIYPDNVDVNPRFQEEVYGQIMDGMPVYLGYVFEDVCTEYVLDRCRNAGKWWGMDPATRTKEEIDIAAVHGGSLVLCECKYRTAPVGKDVIATLIRRSALVKMDLPR